MERREHGLIPAVMLERTLHGENDYRAADEYITRLRTEWPNEIIDHSSFRVSWVTVRGAHKGRCMAKAILCGPDQVEKMQEWFRGLPTEVRASEFPVTYGARFTAIDHSTKEGERLLLEGICRQQAFGSKITYVKLLGLSKVDPFVFEPNMALLKGFPTSTPNTKTMVQLMMGATTISHDVGEVKSPVTKILVDSHPAV